MMDETMIAHISKLAQLRLTEEESIKVQADFDNILRYVDMLQEVDTDGVMPTSHDDGLKNVLRKDAVAPSQSVEDVLANSGNKTEQYFQVPQTVEE